MSNDFLNAQVYEGRAAQISGLADWMHLTGKDLCLQKRTKFIEYEDRLREIASGLLDEANKIRLDFLNCNNRRLDAQRKKRGM